MRRFLWPSILKNYISSHRTLHCSKCQTQTRKGYSLNNPSVFKQGDIETNHVLSLLRRRCHAEKTSSQPLTKLQENGQNENNDVNRERMHKPLSCQPLSHRGLVRVGGEDSGNFLQGLVSNNIRCLESDCDIQALYAFMLNPQGRVLYDLMLYNVGQRPHGACFLIECDKQVLPEFIQNVRRYKIRKKVDIADVSHEYQAWAIFPEVWTDQLEPIAVDLHRNSSVIIDSPDPRLHSLGHRLVLSRDTQATDVLMSEGSLADQEDYHIWRYRHGIGEGVLDIPPGKAFILEANAAFLNGVSFTKGCYIGQELTARTHHRGVIRKRLMPIEFNTENPAVDCGDSIETESGKKCGTFRNSVGKYGLALLRVPDVVGQAKLFVKDADGNVKEELRTHVPSWWPTGTDEIVKQALAKLK